MFQQTIRSELKSMSFAELIKMKEELGSKDYNEALFGDDTSSRKRKYTKYNSEVTFKRENKNRPKEISSKKQVPLLGKSSTSKQAFQPRDPRFDTNCGEFDREKFKSDYSFVNEIREKEIVELKEQLKRVKNDEPDEKQKIKLVLQRMQNQNLEEQKMQERQKIKTIRNHQNKNAIKTEKRPFFISKSM